MNIPNNSRIYGTSEIGENAIISENVTLGYPQGDILQEIFKQGVEIKNYIFLGAKIGKNAVIRSNSIIYSNVKIGNNLRTGHNVLIREKTTIGDDVLIGTNVVIEGDTEIGNNVSIQSNAYIPTNTIIEDHVFLGPSVVLTNDKYPIRDNSKLVGPRIRRGASIGANATILPGIDIGEGAIIGSGSVVTKNVPPWKLAIGVPAKIISDVPEKIRVLNKI